MWNVVSGSFRKLPLTRIFQLVSFSLLKRVSFVKMFSTHAIRICERKTTRKLQDMDYPEPCFTGDYLLEPYLLPHRLNGRKYLTFFETVFSKQDFWCYSSTNMFPAWRRSKTLRRSCAWWLDQKTCSSMDWSRWTNISVAAFTGFIWRWFLCLGFNEKHVVLDCCWLWYGDCRTSISCHQQHPVMPVIFHNVRLSMKRIVWHALQQIFAI